MKEIGIFYGVDSDQTAEIARKIIDEFKGIAIEAVAVEVANSEDLNVYDYIITGVATWPEGTIPAYWGDLVEDIRNSDMTHKRVGIFGLGDQVNYPNNFVDSIGILADAFENAGATLVGFTRTEGYTFQRSRAVMNEIQFKGLAIDTDNQDDQTDERIRKWVKQLKREFFDM
ncbi:MAG: flavodoxin [Tannerellaceae bacterium]|nr:flavodoxin [Tannerellaceae bacterium]